MSWRERWTRAVRKWLAISVPLLLIIIKMKIIIIIDRQVKFSYCWILIWMNEWKWPNNPAKSYLWVFERSGGRILSEHEKMKILSTKNNNNNKPRNNQKIRAKMSTVSLNQKVRRTEERKGLVNRMEKKTDLWGKLVPLILLVILRR